MVDLPCLVFCSFILVWMWVDVCANVYIFTDVDLKLCRVHTLCLPTTASLQEVIQVKQFMKTQACSTVLRTKSLRRKSDQI